MYYAGYDLSQLTLGNMTLATAGESNVVVGLESTTDTDANSDTTSKFFHFAGASGADAEVTSQDASAAQRLLTWAPAGFVDRLETVTQGLAIIAGWSNFADISISIAPATGLVTIAYSPATFSVTFSSTAAANFLGFSGNLSGSTSYTSDQTPTYCINPGQDLVSVEPGLDGFNYEPDAIANLLVSDSGEPYAMARDTAPLYRDWVQQYETRARSFRLAAASTHPWTHQHLHEHCRGGFPFLVYNLFYGDAASEVFMLRTESTQWRPRRAAPAWDVYHVDYRALVVGTAAAP